MKNNTDNTYIIGVAIGLIILVIFCACGGCTRPETAKRVLEEQGYTQIEITGWRPFMKSEKDVYSTGFKAISPNGKQVSGAVTGGFFKGSTIRFD